MSEIKSLAAPKASFDRRAVVKGAAWSVPVIAAAIAAPAAAASATDRDSRPSLGPAATQLQRVDRGSHCRGLERPRRASQSTTPAGAINGDHSLARSQSRPCASVGMPASDSSRSLEQRCSPAVRSTMQEDVCTANVYTASFSWHRCIDTKLSLSGRASTYRGATTGPTPGNLHHDRDHHLPSSVPPLVDSDCNLYSWSRADTPPDDWSAMAFQQ